MVSRERLQRLGATVAKQATTARARMIGHVLLLASLVFIALRVHSLWHGSTVNFSNIDWLAFAGAFLVSGVGVVATGFIWLAVLRRLGAPTERWWMAIFFQSQLAKYIPGALWQYAGRLALARARGLPTRLVARSLPIELVASLAAAGVASLLLFGAWGTPAALAAVAVSFVIAHRTKSGSGKLHLDVSATALAIPLYAAVWVILGSGFWLIARALFSVSPDDLPFFLGAFAAAWIVGVVAIYAPGGLGVREGVLIGLLHSRLGAADALVVAAASRVLLTLIDLLLAGAASLVLRRRDKRPAPDPAGQLVRSL